MKNLLHSNTFYTLSKGMMAYNYSATFKAQTFFSRVRDKKIKKEMMMIPLILLYDEVSSFNYVIPSNFY